MDADKRESTPHRQRDLRSTAPAAPHHDAPAGATPAATTAATTDAATQLQLLDDAHLPDWRLDPSTKAIGLHGIAQARAALRTARRRRADLEVGADGHGGRATAA